MVGKLGTNLSQIRHGQVFQTKKRAAFLQLFIFTTLKMVGRAGLTITAYGLLSPLRGAFAVLRRLKRCRVLSNRRKEPSPVRSAKQKKGYLGRQPFLCMVGRAGFEPATIG